MCLYQEADSDEGEDDTSDDNDEDDDDTKESIDPLFKVDLQAALGNALANEQDDENETEQSDSDLDDDAMMKLDGALAEVFMQHLKAKQEKKKVKGDLLCITRNKRLMCSIYCHVLYLTTVMLLFRCQEISTAF